MTETKCSTFPLIALPVGATDEEKRLLGERLISSAPRYLRWKVELALDQLSVEDIVRRFEFYRQHKHGCCHHATWAALYVPPHMSIAREAVAWTFDMRPELYQPKIET
jgi:hypothetical protein